VRQSPRRCHLAPSPALSARRRPRLKELLRQRLVESQWRDSLKQYTMDLIKKKGGDTPFTVEQLTHEITPQGRETVPDDVKSELLAEIRRFVEGLDSSVQAGVES